MIRFHLSQLIADAQFKTGKRVTLLELSEATGLSRITLSRMLNIRGYSTSTDTLDRLCKYFQCSIADVATYLDDETLPAIAASSSDAPSSATAVSTDAEPAKPPRILKAAEKASPKAAPKDTKRSET